jgi:hypothetical protein
MADASRTEAINSSLRAKMKVFRLSHPVILRIASPRLNALA